MEDFAEAQRMIRTFARQVTRKYDRAHWVERARLDGRLDEVWQELGKAGYLGGTIPEEYGGSGCSVSRLAILTEELSTEGVPLLFLVISAAIASICLSRHASPEQKARYLPKLADGSEKFCFALTEPNAGSNSFRIETVARRDGDEWVIDGQKIFITGADEADHMLLVARTTRAGKEGDKREGMALFIVDLKTPGIESHKIETGILAPERQYQMFFENVRIPATNRVGDESLGIKPLFDALNAERITLGAMTAGLGRFALGKAVQYARTREVFGVPIGSHQALAHPMAEIKTKIELAALMTHHAAALFDSGENAGMYANMAKYAAAEAAIESVDLAMQVHGGMGFTTEADIITLWPFVRLFRTAPVSKEMIMNYIGEHVLGLPRSY